MQWSRPWRIGRDDVFWCCLCTLYRLDEQMNRKRSG